ncbi:MAG: helix-turn-helix transcriptional regulator, partial [Actinobacteria bacterium]|nr:helix-turn-helix transcriptional regulator [Actinomycetota bacterium]
PYDFQGAASSFDPADLPSTPARFSHGLFTPLDDDYMVRGARLNGIIASGSAALMRAVRITALASDRATRLNIACVSDAADDNLCQLEFRTDADETEHEYPGSTKYISLSVPLHTLAFEPSDLDEVVARARPSPVANLFLASLARVLLDERLVRWLPRAGGNIDRYLIELANLVVDAALHPEPVDENTVPWLRLRADALISTAHSDPGLAPPKIADRLGVSLRSLHRAYEGTEGVAHELRRVRLDHASAMLADPEYANLPLSEIAHRSGFGSLATFNRVFSATFTTPPHQFRRSAAHVRPDAPVPAAP